MLASALSSLLSSALCLSLSLFQTLNLLRTVAQIAQTRNLEMALPICDCNCDCKVNFCVHLRLQNALPKKAANSPGQATHVAGSRQRHATSGRLKYATAIIVGNKQSTVPQSRAYSVYSYYIHIHMSPASICARLSFSIPSTSPSLLCCSCCQSVGRFGLLRFQKFPCVISEMQIWT